MTNNDPMPLQWALPDSLEVPPDNLQLRLDFYSETIVMYRMEEGVSVSRPVSAVDIAGAVTRELTFASGLLPRNTLWWSQSREGPQIALWRPAKLTRVAIQLDAFKPPERYHIPMPGLIFICQSRRPPTVFAAARRPRDEKETLFHCPTFNVFSDGRVCPGTHDFPAEEEKIPDSFFESLFSQAGDSRRRSHQYPDDLLKLWEALDGAKKYPMDDLMACGDVGQAQRRLRR